MVSIHGAGKTRGEATFATGPAPATGRGYSPIPIPLIVYRSQTGTFRGSDVPGRDPDRAEAHA